MNNRERRPTNGQLLKTRQLSPENQQPTTMTDTQRDRQTAFVLTFAFQNFVLYHVSPLFHSEGLYHFFLPLLCKLKPKIEDWDNSNNSNDNATISMTNIDYIDNR